MRWLHTMILGAMLVLISAGPVTAECLGPCRVVAPRADRPLTIGVAFTARVVDVSDEPGLVGYQWRVEIEVDHVYRGHVPDRITWYGWRDAESVPLFAHRLKPGDRLFIAAGDYRERARPINPFTPDVIVWKQADAGWSFYARVLPQSDKPEYFPATARSADSLDEILAVVRAAGLPDTSVAAPLPGTPTPDPRLPVLLIAAFGGVLLWLARSHRQRGRRG